MQGKTSYRNQEKGKEEAKEVAAGEDVVEDLVLSSDEDDSPSDSFAGDNDNTDHAPPKQKRLKQRTKISKQKKFSRKDRKQ